jgi:hypothetical protein
MSDRSFRAFVDRIEGDKAVLLAGDREQHRVILPAEYLPDGAAEGTVLAISLKSEPEMTAEALAESERLLQELKDQDKRSS